MSYDELCLKATLAHIFSFTIFYVYGKLPLLKDEPGYRILVGPYSLKALIIAGVLAGLFYSLPGLILLAFLWDLIPNKVRRKAFLPLWGSVVILLSTLVYALMGYIYETTHAWLVYSNEPATRVFSYAGKLISSFIVVSIIGSLIVIILDYGIRRLMKGHGVPKRRNMVNKGQNINRNKEPRLN
ncbi:MAG: hypothetical protein DRJ66_01085 [Thermoprotei archaeon]|nr:MAG: hypothetical protein DRJ66_01085 [Thermoprotei archaeon]